MTKEELAEILNDKENWQLFEELANKKKLHWLPYANLYNADLSKTNMKHTKLGFINLKRAYYSFLRYPKEEISNDFEQQKWTEKRKTWLKKSWKKY